MGTAPHAINALLFEDNTADAFLFESLISDAQDVAFQTRIVAGLEEGLLALETHHLDLILLDLHLPDSDGLDTFDSVHAHAEDCPIIILSGIHDDTVASEAIRRGAQDFLVKGTLEPSVFIRALRHSIERFKLGRLHDEVQREQIELKISKKATHHFLSNVSHELVTPLTASLGFLQLLAQNPSLDQKGREHLNKAVESNEKLRSVVRDVIEMSKIQANQLEMEESEFEFEVIWKGIYRRYAEKAQDKGLIFDDKIGDIGVLHGDQDKVAYVITALVDNAIKFTAQGVVEAYIRMHDRDLSIRVTDTGCGIQEPDRAHAWEAFQSDPDYLSIARKPMGIGLPITQRFVEMMEGVIDLKTSAGGTCVSIELPDIAAQGAMPPNEYDDEAIQVLRGLPAEPLRRLENAVLCADRESFNTLLENTWFEPEHVRHLQESMMCYEFDRLLRLFADARSEA